MKKGFSLIEIIVVIIIISVFAGFALVKYNLLVERAEERNIAMNIRVMMTRLEMKFAKEGYHLIEDQNNLAAINSYLDLNIPDDGKTTYTCTAKNTTVYDRNICLAVSRYGWRVHAHYREEGPSIDDQGNPRRPHCLEHDCCPVCAHIPSGARNCGRALVDGQQGCLF